jgi:hypothetical protein
MTDADPPPDLMDEMRQRASMRPGLKALLAAGIVVALVLLAVASIL